MFVITVRLHFLNCLFPHSLLWWYCLAHFVSQDGWSALMLTSDSGHTDIVLLLLSSGAKLNLQNKVGHSIM